MHSGPVLDGVPGPNLQSTRSRLGCRCPERRRPARCVVGVPFGGVPDGWVGGVSGAAGLKAVSPVFWVVGLAVFLLAVSSVFRMAGLPVFRALPACSLCRRCSGWRCSGWLGWRCSCWLCHRCSGRRWARSPSAPRASLGASARSPARPRPRRRCPHWWRVVCGERPSPAAPPVSFTMVACGGLPGQCLRSPRSPLPGLIWIGCGHVDRLCTSG